VIKIRANLVALVGVLLLMTAAGCAAPAPLPSAMSTSVPTATGTPSSTRFASSTSVAPPATSTAVPVPWNPAGVRSVVDLVPAAALQPASANLPQCGGSEFTLLPSSARTTSTSGGFLTTGFVVQFTGSAPCWSNAGLFGVNMTAADGTIVPIDTMPAGPGHLPLRIGPHQFVFGSVQWAVKPGRPQPTHLTFALGDTPSGRSISIAVADVSIPSHSSTPAPENDWQSSAYGLLTSAVDPATLATLTATMTAPATVRVPSTLRYTVTLTNTTTTTVPLTGCPQFGEQLSVVPVKFPTIIGGRGPLNCSDLPRAITANSSVTMQMQLDTTGEIAGPGGLTWQLLDHGYAATEVVTPVTVQRN